MAKYITRQNRDSNYGYFDGFHSSDQVAIKMNEKKNDVWIHDLTDQVDIDRFSAFTNLSSGTVDMANLETGDEFFFIAETNNIEFDTFTSLQA